MQHRLRLKYLQQVGVQVVEDRVVGCQRVVPLKDSQEVQDQVQRNTAENNRHEGRNYVLVHRHRVVLRKVGNDGNRRADALGAGGR